MGWKKKLKSFDSQIFIQMQNQKNLGPILKSFDNTNRVPW